jgi:hypothetical protein
MRDPIRGLLDDRVPKAESSVNVAQSARGQEEDVSAVILEMEKQAESLTDNA